MLWAVEVTHFVTAGELLDGHSVLDIECLDRLYLNAYVPTLQSSGQVVAFMTRHLGIPRCASRRAGEPIRPGAATGTRARRTG
jgi:hypothetical protein